MPRRSGKSTIAEIEFLKSPEDSVFIGPNQRMLSHINSSFTHKNRFLTQNSSMQGRSYKTAIIDEYMLFDLKGLKNMYQNLPMNGVENVLIYSTSRTIDKEVFDYIKLCKIKNIYWRSADGLKLFPQSIRIRFETNSAKKNDRLFEYLDSLYFNFITDSDTEVVYKLSEHTTVL